MHQHAVLLAIGNSWFQKWPEHWWLQQVCGVTRLLISFRFTQRGVGLVLQSRFSDLRQEHRQPATSQLPQCCQTWGFLWQKVKLKEKREWCRHLNMRVFSGFKSKTFWKEGGHIIFWLFVNQRFRRFGQSLLGVLPVGGSDASVSWSLARSLEPGRDGKKVDVERGITWISYSDRP